MKRIFVLLFVFYLFTQAGYSAPNYDKNNITTEWDPAENIALRNKLEEEYYKRHTIDEHHMNGGPEAYYREVLVPYCLNKKKMEDLPKRYYKIEEEIK